MKRQSLVALVLVSALGLAGCDTTQKIRETPSGRPEVTLYQRPDDVAARLAGVCLDQGLIVREQSPYQVVCSKELSGFEAAIATLAIGNSYSTAPTQNIRFSLVRQENGTRVQAYQWIETQMAFGQINRSKLNSGQQFNDTQSLLDSLRY